MVKIMNYEFKKVSPMKCATRTLRFDRFSRHLVAASVFVLSFIIYNSQFRIALAQQPQAPAGTPLYSVNAKYVNGMAPGYWPTAGSGLTLSLSAGTAYCGNPPVPVSYPGGSLALVASTTNYIYLDPANNCSPAVSTSTFSAGQIPIAKVVAGASSITSITDARTWFAPQPCVAGSAGDIHCTSMGTNQNITLTPSGTGASVVTNLEDKGGQVFNVKAYGAKMDGTTDDASAIQAAIIAMPSAGGTLFFPSGNCLIGTPISLNKPVRVVLGAGTYTATSTAFTISHSGVQIVGKGTQTTILQTTSTSALIDTSGNTQGGLITDLHLTGPTTGASGSGLINLVNVNSYRVNRIATTGGYYGVYLRGSYMSNYSNIVTSQAISAGLLLDGGTGIVDYVQVNTFRNVDASNGPGKGIELTVESSSGLVDANAFYDSESNTNGDIGWDIQNTEGGQIFYNCIAVNNTNTEWNIAGNSNRFFFIHAENGSTPSHNDIVVSGNENDFFQPRAYRGDPDNLQISGKYNDVYSFQGSSAVTNEIHLTSTSSYNNILSGYVAGGSVGVLEDSGAQWNSIRHILITGVTTKFSLSGSQTANQITGQPFVTTGSGAPAGGCTTGSLYLRSDGGGGSTLYVCESGAWVAK